MVVDIKTKQAPMQLSELVQFHFSNVFISLQLLVCILELMFSLPPSR